MVKPTIDALTATVPQLGQSAAEFDANTNDFLPQLVPLQAQINVAVDWVEDQVTAIGFSASEASDAADEAEFAQAAAMASANYIGAWSSLTGALAPPASVSHSGKVWLLIAGLADVTANEPGVDAGWIDITAFSGDYSDLDNLPTLGTAAARNTGITENTVPLLGAGGELPAVGGTNLTGIVGTGLSRASKTTITSGVGSVDIALPPGKGAILIEGRGITFSGKSVKLETSTDGVTFAGSAGDYRHGKAGTPSSILISYTTGDETSFWGVLRGANNPNAYFSGEFFSTVDGLNSEAPNVGTRFVKEAVTHIRISSSSSAFTGGEILVSQVLEVS